MIESHTFEKILRSRLRLEKLKNQFTSRKIEFRVQHEEYFEQLHAKLKKHSTIEEFWASLSQCWSYFNHTILKSLIRRLRYTDLKEELNQYLDSFQDFQCKTRLCDFSEYLSNPRGLPGLDLTVYFDLRWEVCTLEELHHLQNDIRCLCQIPCCCTALQEISQGSLIVTWSVPKEIALHARNQLGKIDLKHFSDEHSILSIDIDDEEVICSDEIGTYVNIS